MKKGLYGLIGVLLLGCGSDDPVRDQDDSPVDRVKIESIQFKDSGLANCIEGIPEYEAVTYADEVVSLFCGIRGGVPDNPLEILSTEEFSYFHNLRQLSLIGHRFSELDLSYFPNLKSLTITDSLKTEFDFIHNKNLEEVEISSYADGQSQRLEFEIDLSKNSALRTVSVNSVSQLVLPENAPLELVSVRFNTMNSGAFSNYGANVRELDFEQYTSLKQLNLIGVFSSLTLPKTSSLEILGLAGSVLSSPANLAEQVKLKSLKIKLSSGQESLDLSGLENLETLDLYGAGIKAVDFPSGSKLAELKINSAVLDSLSFDNLLSLESVTLVAPRLQALSFSNLSRLNYVTINSFDLNTLAVDEATGNSLAELRIDDSQLSELTLGGCGNLSLLDLGNSKLNKLDLSHCSGLKDVHLQRTELDQLELQSNQQLEQLAVVDGFEKRVVLPAENSVLVEAVDSGVTIDDFLTEHNQDIGFRRCIENAVQDLSVTYVDEITQIVCPHDDGKFRVSSLYAYVNDELIETNTYTVFSAQGLELFENLEYLDLSGNWLNTIQLPKKSLRSVDLSHNVFQNVDLHSNDTLEDLNLIENPLNSLHLPKNLNTLKLNNQILWAYTDIGISNGYDIERMKDSVTDNPLVYDDFAQITKVGFWGYLERLDSEVAIEWY